MRESLESLLDTPIWKTLPSQEAGRPWLKYLILVPLCRLAFIAFFIIVLVPIASQSLFGTAEATLNKCLTSHLMLLVVLTPIVGAVVYDLGREVVVMRKLLRGRQRAELPTDRPLLTHAVVIAEYKEPLDVLAATVASLQEQTLAHNTIVVLAQEARDAGADETFLSLKAVAEKSFFRFMCTRHELQPGEVAGKSSNENFAVRQLYRSVLDMGLDPFNVMVTVADADSYFDRVFLEQVESEFWRTPDGRRMLFDSPINTVRNLAECNLLVQCYEVYRCQTVTFNHLTMQPCQSNYSMMLGFAHELNYWDPDNTSEDMHTTLKAIAYTSAPADCVVTVWSLIMNDSVAGFQDRWVQAKRHMWGVEEVAWLISLLPVLRWRVWYRMLGITQAHLLNAAIPSWMIFCFPQTWWALMDLGPTMLSLVLAGCILPFCYGWVKFFAREAFMQKYILGHRRDIMLPMEWWRWAILVLTYPIVLPISRTIFVTMAVWRMLWHAVFHSQLKYVTAPKQFSPKAAVEMGASFSFTGDG
ncbi:CC2D2A [Symbiodinium sp. CCMP2592]|nr:CC2D2A [Symbiodinium sp. CCMP2592]